jgi:hypothetical protein
MGTNTCIIASCMNECVTSTEYNKKSKLLQSVPCLQQCHTTSLQSSGVRPYRANQTPKYDHLKPVKTSYLEPSSELFLPVPWTSEEQWSSARISVGRIMGLIQPSRARGGNLSFHTSGQSLIPTLPLSPEASFREMSELKADDLRRRRRGILPKMASRLELSLAGRRGPAKN